jgi:hypothetical protein
MRGEVCFTAVLQGRSTFNMAIPRARAASEEVDFEVESELLACMDQPPNAGRASLGSSLALIDEGLALALQKEEWDKKTFVTDDDDTTEPFYS